MQMLETALAQEARWIHGRAMQLGSRQLLRQRPRNAGVWEGLQFFYLAAIAYRQFIGGPLILPF